MSLTLPSYALPPGVRVDDIPRDWMIVGVHGPEMGAPAEISYDLAGRTSTGDVLIAGVRPWNRDRHNTTVAIYRAAIGDPAIPNFDGATLRFFVHEEKVMTEACA